jgi:hypothetical protein
MTGRRIVVVNDRMQHGLSLRTERAAGRDFAPDFTPELTPQEMLALGVFGGKYMTDCRDEFPRRAWFDGAKLADGRATGASTSFASTPASRCPCGARRAGSTPTIRAAGSSGTAATMGRRLPEEDRRQIGRWKAISRHVRQIERTASSDLSCRPRQRQALLHWAYDSRRL